MGLKGAHFTTMENIKLNETAKIWKIPKEAFRWCFQQSQDPCSKYAHIRALF
jgi:hypothetical protein